MLQEILAFCIALGVFIIPILAFKVLRELR
ncbi:hypothetical protein HMPREF2087_00262 [Helicobacter canis NCTC 12740]|uniref:Uncharacterized protein n=1 Tax=Helicobacter canis NCTC 12740 TaxID=1357399 RepID=V8CJZ7_9HELI|nr:hypothetical protein HMPREF2087_00262 [Helicobacter canis NCTC 12740]